MLARIRSALVNVRFATTTSIAWRAVTDKLVDSILAATTVDTRIGGTFVHVT